METIGAMLERRRVEVPGVQAVVDDDSSATYDELVAGAWRVAGYMVANGVQPGDRVALLMPPSVAWATVHYGVILSGAIVVPLNLSWRADELDYAVRQSRPTCVLAAANWKSKPLASALSAIVPQLATHDNDAATLAPMPWLRFGVAFGEASADLAAWRPGAQALNHESTAREDREVRRRLHIAQPRATCCIVYTSGSSGRPKPAMLHHGGLLEAAMEYGRCIDMRPSDRLLVPWPTFHVSGISAGMMMGHQHRATSRLMEAYAPGHALEIIEREGITSFSGFDTTFTTMLGSAEFTPSRVRSVRSLLLATGPAMYDRVFRSFPGLEIASKCYAMTETCGPSVLAYPCLRDPVARKHSQGIPIPGAQLRIVDPQTGKPLATSARGEIQVKGPLLFNGYFDMQDETLAAFDGEGWFRTGDLGHLDDAGRLYYTGRLKRMIKTGGENVSEREVEVFLEDQVPGVNIAQVVGVPDALWGEAVVAFVEPLKGVDLGDADVRTACKDRIAGYKIPKRVWILQEHEWPRNDVGKISKDALTRIAHDRLGGG